MSLNGDVTLDATSSVGHEIHEALSDTCCVLFF